MEFVIVLGCSDRTLQEARVKRGVEYFSSIKPLVNPDLQVTIPRAILVLSGRGKFQPSEAKNMYNYALGLGVKSDSCIVEDQSMNTEENILFSLKKIKSLGYLKPTFNMGITFIICTSEFHLRRATIIAISKLLPYGKVQSIGTPDEYATEERKKHEYLFTLCYINSLLESCRVEEKT
jgi:uncharacterized SAM-binding protein YcdF (DUF218 family)